MFRAYLDSSRPCSSPSKRPALGVCKNFWQLLACGRSCCQGAMLTVSHTALSIRHLPEPPCCVQVFARAFLPRYQRAGRDAESGVHGHCSDGALAARSPGPPTVRYHRVHAAVHSGGHCPPRLQSAGAPWDLEVDQSTDEAPATESHSVGPQAVHCVQTQPCGR